MSTQARAADTSLIAGDDTTRDLIEAACEVRDLLNKTPTLQGREFKYIGLRFVNAIGAAQRAYRLSRPATSAASEGEGVDYATLSDLHTIKGWLHGLATNPDLNDVVADGGVTTGDCYQQEAREFAGRIGRVIAALASPPVSELLREARWYVNDHQESQPNDETKDLLARIDGALK